MARRMSKVERFVSDCSTATPEELTLMLDILKGMIGKKGPAKPKVQAKPKAVKAEPQAVSGD